MPNPTWAVFAVSGLAAWLIDNWLCTRPFAFVLIFIPTSDISSVRCCPGSESQAGEPDWPPKNRSCSIPEEFWVERLVGAEGGTGHERCQDWKSSWGPEWEGKAAPPHRFPGALHCDSPRGAAAPSPLPLEQRAGRARPTVSALEAGVKAWDCFLSAWLRDNPLSEGDRESQSLQG